MTCTPAQVSAYWSMFSRACSRMGLPSRDEKEAYRKRVLRETIGEESMKRIGSNADYEKVMLRLATDAEDWEAADRYALGDVLRLRHVILEAARRIVEAGGKGVTPERYVAGILFQGRMVYRPFETGPDSYAVRLESDSDEWRRIPALTLRKALMALTIEVRRLKA